MFRGMATVSYYADDLKAATEWYTEFLGIDPYFAMPVDGPPAYVEYRLGDYQAELGLIDRRYAPPGASGVAGGAVLFWAVDDIEATLEKLKSMGATEYEPLTPRSSGFVTASVVDPFGNILGIMINPHYEEVLKAARSD